MIPMKPAGIWSFGRENKGGDMKVSIAITLDGLVTALRHKGHAAAEEAEYRSRRSVGAGPSDGWKTTPERGEARGNEDDDVASS